MTYYNCGEPSRFVGICSKPKVCFICAILGHYMTKCPKWKKTQPIASYFSSAGKGLGFYHIDLLEMETTRWLNINNCGVVLIRKGSITMTELERWLNISNCGVVLIRKGSITMTELERWLNISNCGVVLIRKGSITMTELEKELSDIFYKDWPSQKRELTPNRYLVRFPPHRRVKDIKNLPSFNLRKEGVQVEVVEWIGDLDHFGQLTEAWVHLDGIPPPPPHVVWMGSVCSNSLQFWVTDGCGLDLSL
jgi:uncharacterized beta-barrel protein YwiB (DUF1934 family)